VIDERPRKIECDQIATKFPPAAHLSPAVLFGFPLAAGVFGVVDLIQCGEPPELPFTFDTILSRPSLRA
jgi:hypothetical protein